MKKRILLIGVILLASIGPAKAQNDQLGIDLDLTWVSKYIWRGFDLLDDKAAFQPSINLDLYGTGFSANVWASYAGASKGGGSISTVNATEYDYTIAYDCTLFEGQNYSTDVTANYIYYDFIDEPTKAADAQEIGVGFAWPNICPFGSVPSYYVSKIWPTRSDSALTGEYGGWLHIFGLGYDLTVANLLPDKPEHVISLSANLVYNDGFAGATVDHDWSHVVWGASTAIGCGSGTFTPALYYQTSMEDTVNPEDELWVSLSYKLGF